MESKVDIRHIRSEFGRDGLSENGLPENPIVLFDSWLREANGSEEMEGIAFTLATVTIENRPSARTLLLRGTEGDVFSFFTNFKSRKGRELEANGNAVAHFFWPVGQRQVRASGVVTRLSEENSDDYFASRPRESQIGAWASVQSEVIPSREWLENEVKKFSEKFEGVDIPRPPHWGGYQLAPEKIEFWQGRTSRLHDRILYTKEGEGWTVCRLSP